MSGSIIVQPKKKRNNQKIFGFVMLLVFFVMSMIFVFAYVAGETNKNRNYLGGLSDQMLILGNESYSIEQLQQGDQQAIKELKILHQQVKMFEQGAINYFAPSLKKESIATLTIKWQKYDKTLNAILFNWQVIENVREKSQILKELLPVLKKYSIKLSNELLKQNSERTIVNIAMEQSLVLDKIQIYLEKILLGGADVNQSIESFTLNAAKFERMLNKIQAKKEQKFSLAAQKQLTLLNEYKEAFGKNVEIILNTTTSFIKILNNIQTAKQQLLDLQRELHHLQKALLTDEENITSYNFIGYALGLLAFLTLIVMSVWIYRNTQRRLKNSTDENQRSELAIMRLLDEMTDLADGDLTVRATVTEDITGAIADSINYAIEALSNLVVRINDTSEKLITNANRTQSSAARLTEASNLQANEVISASAAIAEMANSIDIVSDNAKRSEIVAKKSAEISQRGAQTVRQTIQSMAAIREQIQETSKRIKRLGESSQEISDIVRLINDIADQTNVLALNAAIQASAAGEAGRGFAVVADEVQQLAERSTAATRQIGSLVKTIQADTQETVNSMETTTANVVIGVKNVEHAGGALDEIEQVSATLATLVSKISTTSAQQSIVSKDALNAMEVIQGVAMQTSERTYEASDIISSLTQTAIELRSSVSGFRFSSSHYTEQSRSIKTKQPLSALKEIQQTMTTQEQKDSRAVFKDSNVNLPLKDKIDEMSSLNSLNSLNSINMDINIKNQQTEQDIDAKEVLRLRAKSTYAQSNAVLT